MGNLLQRLATALGFQRGTSTTSGLSRRGLLRGLLAGAGLGIARAVAPADVDKSWRSLLVDEPAADDVYAWDTFKTEWARVALPSRMEVRMVLPVGPLTSVEVGDLLTIGDDDNARPMRHGGPLLGTVTKSTRLPDGTVLVDVAVHGFSCPLPPFDAVAGAADVLHDRLRE